MVLQVLQQLMSGANAMQIKDIGVITPYSGQVHFWPCNLWTIASVAVGAYCNMFWCLFCYAKQNV